MNSDMTMAQDLEILRRSVLFGTRPVTIKQIQNAERAHSEADFCIDDIAVNKVKVVAQVLSGPTVQGEGGTLITLKLIDGTSTKPVTAKQWLSDAADGFPELRPADDPNAIVYVAVIGSLAKNDPGLGRWGKSMTIDSIAKVTDAHQVLLHCLEAAYVTMCLERGPPTRENAREAAGAVPVSAAQTRTPPRPSPAPQQVPTPSPSQRSASQSSALSASGVGEVFATPPSTPRKNLSAVPPAMQTPSSRAPSEEFPSPGTWARYSGNPAPSVRRRDPYSHLDTLQRSILLVIQEEAPSSANGVDVQRLVDRVRVSHDSVTALEICDALDSLMAFGHIVTVNGSELNYTIAGPLYPRLSQI